MIRISDYISRLPVPPELIEGLVPWQVPDELGTIIGQLISTLDEGYLISHGVAVHTTAEIEPGAVIKAPAVIGPDCFIAANAYLRGGVILGEKVVIGPGCEVKSSVIASGTALAHFNYIGNSLVGSDVNFEAGALVANHHNDRTDKRIFVRTAAGEVVETGVTKFGAVVGDHCRVGANAVIAPGNLLLPETIVPRLTLMDAV